MQYFRDNVTGVLYAFEDDVRCEQDENGVWHFYAPEDAKPLPAPYPVTLQPTEDTTPPPYVPTTEDNVRMRDMLLRVAAERIAPLQDAVDLGIETPDDVAALKAWKSYRVALNRLEMSLSPVQWPPQPTGD
ncbi:tail fiber assembly protein [Cupriavidus sp. SIMBA_020]|uniref:tail fiber assembly protein n=1 Tax=Cupriavidus sp. SIMBA_020 TaxID=3085766 RepID=UPI00397D186F